MKLAFPLAAAGLCAALTISGEAGASVLNLGPPPGPVILDLDGQPAFPLDAYHLYGVDFTATLTSTDLTFAFRNDPSYLHLDNVALRTGGGPNLLINGGFESGPIDVSAPTGWSYSAPFGSTSPGLVSDDIPFAGNLDFKDGAVGAYDLLTQTVATTIGATYHLSFWLLETSNLPTYSSINTGPDSGDRDNAMNLVVYATGAAPAAGAVPEPATWAMMLIGFGGLGALLRRRRAFARLQLI